MLEPVHHLRYHYIPLMAKALKGLFPKVSLLGGGLTDHGFFYDFMLEEGVVDAKVMLAIEERMAELLYSDLQFSVVEMMRDVAVNYLAHQQQHAKAHLLKNEYSPGLMCFLKIDPILEYTSEPIQLIDAKQLKHFSLLETRSFPSESGSLVTRIEGTASFSKQELKLFKKKRKGFLGFDHLTLAKKKQLYEYDSELGEGVWLPKGVEWLQLFFALWKNFCSTLHIQEISTAASSEAEFCEKLHFIQRSLASPLPAVFGEILFFEAQHLPKDCKGMWRANKFIAERAAALVKWDNVGSIAISFLHFIAKTVSMLGSDCCWVISSPAIGGSTFKQRESRSLSELRRALEVCNFSYETEFVEGDAPGTRAYCLLSDGLGGRWKGPFVGVSDFDMPEGPEALVDCSLFGSVERMTASLLERNRGNIPFAVKDLLDDLHRENSVKK